MTGSSQHYITFDNCSCICDMAPLPYLSDNLCQSRIAHDQPASGGDAIGLVLEFLWIHLIEVFEPIGNINGQWSMAVLRYFAACLWERPGWEAHTRWLWGCRSEFEPPRWWHGSPRCTGGPCWPSYAHLPRSGTCDTAGHCHLGRGKRCASRRKRRNEKRS